MVNFKLYFHAQYHDRAVKTSSLCPTRWTVRAKVIQHVLDQYESILAALEESKGDAATRPAGLLTKLQKGNTYVILCLAENIIGQRETL